MRVYKLFIVLLIVGTSACVHHPGTVSRPKLVVGIVIDQMRWDYLYRYADLYGANGFKRLLGEGFSCENTMVNYVPSYTAPGHSCIYTGSVPSIHGIAGNDWIDNYTGHHSYCVDDNTVHPAVPGGAGPSMSPRNLLVTTVTDELRLATNMSSRVYGVAIKDRGCILPAGHLANGAYWFDDSAGIFYSSSYYPNPSPKWLQTFNARKVPDSLMKFNWDLLYPAGKYSQSLTDGNQYEQPFKGEKAAVFPHKTDSLTGRNVYKAIKAMPAGNALTFDAAMACMEGEKLGRGPATDFMCISLSSTDYAGHQFGPNSMEVEDMYLRLDKEIAAFLKYLDAILGRGNYLLFLTADHGAAHNPQFLQDEDVPAGYFGKELPAELNNLLKAEFGRDNIVRDFVNYQVFLNEQMIDSTHIDREKVKADIVAFLNKKPEVAYAIDMDHMGNTPLPEPIKTMVTNGYYRRRSGCIQVVLSPAWYEAGSSTAGTTHGVWNPYDTHIPLLWYGWHIKNGHTNNRLNMTDISATLAAMLHIQMPNGCIGKPITEITNAAAKD